MPANKAKNRSKALFLMGATIFALILAVIYIIINEGNVRIAGAEYTGANQFGIRNNTEGFIKEDSYNPEEQLGLEIVQSSALASTSSRDISVGLANIEADLEAERLELIAQEQAELDRYASHEATANYPSGLEPLDLSVGREEFMSIWTQRIDAYLAGGNLAGMGAVFVEAAWENGVDPRWSPAISMTESTQGANCFLPYNAWGWGKSSWPNWSDAIRGHVSGLASGYGFTISTDAARAYCPPTYMHWFETTVSEMKKI